ncbi:MAG: hypothetical protein ACYDDZ_05980 [Acidimicrobiales bacterium]
MTRSWNLLARATGELLFAAYWNQRGLSREYKPRIDGLRPDFRVKLPSGKQLVAEVGEPEELAEPQGRERAVARLARNLAWNTQKAGPIPAGHRRGWR